MVAALRLTNGTLHFGRTRRDQLQQAISANLNHDLGEFNQAFVLMLLGGLLLLPPLLMALYRATTTARQWWTHDGAKRLAGSPYVKVSHRYICDIPGPV